MKSNGNDFHNYHDHGTYFLKEDALRCISYDYYFSPTSKYYCDAGCKVCYIEDQLKEGKSFYKNSMPKKMDTEWWLDTFQYFYSIRTDDDLVYLKKFHTDVFEWYKDHAHLFEFGMTDNSMLKHYRMFMDEITWSRIADITISEDFLNKVNITKVMDVLAGYSQKYDIGHIKIIRTSSDYHHPYKILQIIDYLRKLDCVFSVHQDFRSDEINRYDLAEDFDNQNLYVFSDDKRRYQIHRSSVHLFDDSFYFSYDDASNINIDPFYIVDKSKKFNPKDFLYHMLVGKIEYYKTCIKDMGDPKNTTAAKFLDYFKTTQTFKVNKDYNFIPDFMLDDQTVYYTKLIEYGFVKTPVGLYLPGEEAVPLIDYK